MKGKFFKNLQTKVLFLTLMFIAIYYCFYNLGSRSFFHHDESIHANVAYDMYLNNNWFTPRFYKQAYYNKPPFKLWLTAISIPVLGDSNFAFRFWDAFAGVGTILIVFIFCLELFNSAVAGFFAGLFLLCSRTYLFNHIVRQGTQDSMLVFLTTIALYFAWKLFKDLKNQESSNKNAILFGIFCGLAVFTKSIAGLISLIIFASLVLWEFRIQIFKREFLKKFLFLITISFLIPLAWYLPSYLFANLDLDNTLEVERLSHGYHNRNEPFLYLENLTRNGVLPSIILCLASILGLYRAISGQQAFRLLLCWAAVPLFLYSIIPSRVLHYLAPAFPAYAIISGALIAEIFKLAFQSHKINKVYRIILATIFIYFSYLTFFQLRINYKLVARASKTGGTEKVIRALKSLDQKVLIYQEKDNDTWLAKNLGDIFYLSLLGKNKEFVVGTEQLSQKLKANSQINFAAILSRTNLSQDLDKYQINLECRKFFMKNNPKTGKPIFGYIAYDLNYLQNTSFKFSIEQLKKCENKA